MRRLGTSPPGDNPADLADSIGSILSEGYEQVNYPSDDEGGYVHAESESVSSSHGSEDLQATLDDL